MAFRLLGAKPFREPMPSFNIGWTLHKIFSEILIKIVSYKKMQIVCKKSAIYCIFNVSALT